MQEFKLTNGEVEVMKWLLGEVKEAMDKEMEEYQWDNPCMRDWSVEQAQLEMCIRLLNGGKE